jgi:hypothetical protein
MGFPSIKYTVTSVTTDEVTVDALVDGQTVPAKVDRLVVEATSSDGAHGHTFRFGSGTKAEDFAVGSTFVATFTPDADTASVPAAPAEQPPENGA